MQATEGALIAIVFGILLAHLALLRFLHRCKDLMPTAVDGALSVGLHPLTDSLAAIEDRHAVVSEQLAEVCRIGADLADALEAIPSGAIAGPSAPTAGPVDLQTTIMELMLSRVMAGLDASQTQQERPIYEGQATTHDPEPHDDDPTTV